MRGDVLLRAPPHPGIGPRVVLQPDERQHDDGRDFAQPRRRVGHVERVEQGVAVGADRQREGVTGRRLVRQAIAVGVARIAPGPLRLGLLPQPRGIGRRERVERVPRRLDDQLQTVEAPHGRPDRGRVGPLPPMGLDEAALATPCQERLKQQLLRLARSQATVKLAQDRGVETRVIDYVESGLVSSGRQRLREERQRGPSGATERPLGLPMEGTSIGKPRLKRCSTPGGSLTSGALVAA